MALQLGPILQFRGSTNGYLVSALVILDADDAQPQVSAVGAVAGEPIEIAAIPFDTPTMRAWRIEVTLI